MTQDALIGPWPSTVLESVQRMLDESLEKAGPIQRSFFGKPERRLNAADYLATWNSLYMCAVATASPDGWPHLAAVKIQFDANGDLDTLVYRGSRREADLLRNNQVALQKQSDNGTVLTIYARATFRDGEPKTDPRGRQSIHAALAIVRMYGIGPYVSGPLAAPQAAGASPGQPGSPPGKSVP